MSSVFRDVYCLLYFTLFMFCLLDTNFFFYHCSARYRLIVGAVDAGFTDPLAAKFTDLYLFGPREETVVQKEDLHLFGPPEETVVRKEALLLVSSVRGLTNAVPTDLLENLVLFYS
jgi:hypothetical protein